METLLAVLLGVGLAAACGFRVFVPLLVASFATWSGHLVPAPDFLWLGSTPALVALSAATVLEIGAFYVPWLDNLLDTAAVPAAIVAGTLLTGAFVEDMSPVLRWGTALIAGGGVAASTSTGMALVRAASTATTGGLGNPVVATAETFMAGLVSVVAAVAPVVGMVLVVVVGMVVTAHVVRGGDSDATDA